jgi:hypothetical protein
MNIILTLVFALLIIPSAVYAEGKTSSEIRFKVDEGYTEVKAGSFLWIPLPLKNDAQIEILVDVQNRQFDDLSVFVCDQLNLSLLKNNLPSKCWGKHRQKDKFSISGDVIATSPHYLVFSNTFSLIVKKKLNYSVYATISTPWQLARDFEQNMSALSSSVSNTYGIDDFDITLQPCHQENAFSEKATGNIIVCSELFMELGRTNQSGTLLAILLHEIGHSLLNKLGLPNWDNEETVDEFALYSLYQANKQELAFTWIEWHEAQLTKPELIYRLNNDERHPLSAQRARNARRLINSPKEMVNRWNNLLYPYMTDQALKELIGKQAPHSNVPLARQILASRS